MTDAFDSILGQPQVRDYLRACVSNDLVTHAYLFTGPAGSNKTQAAFAFAQALLCPKGSKGPRGGGCGECENCSRTRKRTHPDVRYFAPEGAKGYLIEQIREIVTDVTLAPIQANKKVYIIDRADLLGVSSANAFLKTLEEPPDNVVIILLGRTRESVLPTIVSRCQIVPFRHIPPLEAAGIVAQNTGADIERARFAIEACSGSITRAISFLRDEKGESLHFRADIFRMLGSIAAFDDRRIIEEVKSLLQRLKAPNDEMRAKMEEEIAKNADFLAKSAIRQLEVKNKRTLTAQSTQRLHQVVALIESWLRDVSVVCAGAPELVINTDFLPDIKNAASMTDISKVSESLRRIDETTNMLNYNVSSETFLDVILMEVREALND